MAEMKETQHADRVQLAYAGVLAIASNLGIVFVAAGFLVYVFRLLPLSVPVEQVASLWHLRASELHALIHVPSGWNCLQELGRGDALSYASIIYLSSVTMFCLLSAASAFFRGKDYIYTAISLLQLAVLVFAAAGIVSGGH
jgi:hypothetical protein